MRNRSIQLAVIHVLGLTLAAQAVCSSANTDKQAPIRRVSREVALAVVDRGIGFLTKESAQWRKEHACGTCHQGVMTIWALAEAKERGFNVDTEALTENIKWSKDRFLVPAIDQPVDPRPGYNAANAGIEYLSIMSQMAPSAEILTTAEQNRIADHVVRHQNGDGSWPVPPAQNGPPPYFESPQVVALLAVHTFGPGAPTDRGESPAIRDSRQKGLAWLNKAGLGDTTQTAALGLLLDVRSGKPHKQLKQGIDRLLKRQNPDGGWSPETGLTSDAYATGQALYALSYAGVKNDKPAIAKGVSFLAATQREDGSWPMIPRAAPGAKPFKNPSPITYLGSTWATLGLVRSVPAEK